MSEPKLTRNQSLVLEVLNRDRTPLSAYSILDRLKESGLRAPLQVYRALNKLVERGLVHRLESLNAFVACRSSDCCEHSAAVFAICESCGGVAEFADAKLSRRVNEWARSDGFQLTGTTIELRGECRACSGS